MQFCFKKLAEHKWIAAWSEWLAYELLCVRNRTARLTYLWQVQCYVSLGPNGSSVDFKLVVWLRIYVLARLFVIKQCPFQFKLS